LDWVGLRAPDVVRPLDSGTLTVYGVASSMVHAPAESLSALWAASRLDLNQDGQADLIHPRVGAADAFSSDISNVVTGAGNANNILRRTGSWIDQAGFSIDHGPMLLMIDNYLSNNFVPKLFMSHPSIQDALAKVFPSQRFIRKASADGTSMDLEWAGFDIPVRVQKSGSLSPPSWTNATDVLTTNRVSILKGPGTQEFYRLFYP
jgi:hypothetical protein